MKNSSIGLALGLAAIDGLTCAFVAMLILALVLIGPGETSSAPDLVESKSLTIRVTDMNQTGVGVDLRLLVDISVEGSSQVTPAFTVESQGRMTPLRTLQSHVNGNGRVWWQDCQALSGHTCVAQLFVSSIKQHERPWHIRLRVADSGNSFTIGDGSYEIEASLGDHVLPNLSLTPSAPLVICAEWDKNSVRAPCL
jgi:hypothetical protein